MELTQCLTHIRGHLSNIFLYSGRYIFRLGRYHQCINAQGLDYYFLQMGSPETNDSPLFYGCCLPNVCSPATIQLGLNFVLKQAQLPLEVKNVVNKIEEYSQPFNLSFFVTLLIFSVIITLVLMGTLSAKIKEHKIFSAFAIQSTAKVFKYSQASRLNVLNGVKSLSMLWVIFGHIMSMAIGYSLNILTINPILQDWKFLIVEAGLYSVDTFFFVGGFLLAYSFLKEKSKTNKKHFLAILNRILRFLPAYFFSIMIFYSVFPHLGEGPFWQNQLKVSKLCHSLWRPLLFIDNLVQNGDNMCMGWGWYLQNDMQLFIYCVLIIFIYQKKRVAGFVVIILSSIGNFIYVFQQTYRYHEKWLNHTTDTQNGQRYQLNIYFKPWSRCPPYLYGLFLGILYHQFLVYQQNKLNKTAALNQSTVSENKINTGGILSGQSLPILQKIKEVFLNRPCVRRAIELIGVCICLFVSFIPRTNQGSMFWPQIVHSIYLTFGKLIFVFGLSLVILPSIILPINKSQRLIVRFLLDTKLFNFIGKISYCTYLIHLVLLLLYFGSFKKDFYYTMYPTFMLFASFSAISLLCGLILFLLVEQPFSQLQRLLMKTLIKKQAKLEEESIHVIENENKEKRNNQQVAIE